MVRRGEASWPRLGLIRVAEQLEARGVLPVAFVVVAAAVLDLLPLRERYAVSRSGWHAQPELQA